VVGIVVQLSFLSRPVCLPVLARLWRPRHTGKIAHARQLAELIAARYPDRTVHVVGDAAYVGEHLRNLGGRISWTSRLKITSVLHELPPPRTGRSGRPRTRGARLGTPAACGTARFGAEPCGSFWCATISLELATVTIAGTGSRW
jgi:hypothetical protein